jgi:SAM-dependent methyltransferase
VATPEPTGPDSAARGRVVVDRGSRAHDGVDRSVSRTVAVAAVAQYSNRVPQPWMTRTSAEVFDSDVVPRLLAAPAELLLDALPPLQPQMRFLEVGARGGVIARTLIERIAGLGRLVSVDVDDAAVRALPAGPRRAARAVAGLPLPFADGAFDVALANLLLGGHDDDVAFAALRRVLKPGGWLLATALVRGSWDALFDLVGEACETIERVDVGDRVQAIRDDLSGETRLVATAEAHRLVPAHGVGVEDRLVGFAMDGAALRADPLVRDLLLPTWCGDDVAADAAFAAALDDVVRAYFPGGVPLVVRTALLVLRAA